MRVWLKQYLLLDQHVVLGTAISPYDNLTAGVKFPLDLHLDSQCD